MTIREIATQIEAIQEEFERDLSDQKSISQGYLDSLRSAYLGKKGKLAQIFKIFPQLDTDERKEAGKLINPLKNRIEEKLRELENNLLTQRSKISQTADISLPSMSVPRGHLHPLTITIKEIYEIFKRLGFQVAEGPEIETDYYNFEALNFPHNHPARDMQDTFYITPDRQILLRTHTSPVQIRYMLSKKNPPVRAIFPGRVYRNEAISPRSFCVFHQVEGLYVDTGVSFTELKGILEIFCKQFFGVNVRLRFRPSFFPFTEPSAEVDISCVICSGKGCRVCKYTGWLEILGCGMVDPNLYSYVGFDSDLVSGYAFGMGVERIAMLKYGIDDIRLFYENDMRFLRQF